MTRADGRPAATTLLALAGCGLLGWTACGECTPFEEMDVRDRTGDDRDDLVAEVEAAIGDFAAWTGRETVCVPGIDIVHDQGGVWDYGGLYHGTHRRIDISADAAYPSHDITVHELCHALDENEDDLALRRPEAFGDPEPLLHPDTTCSDEETCIREAFAQICDDGPRDTRLEDVHEQACGIEVLQPWDRVVQHEVYAAYHAALEPFAVVPQELPTFLLDRTYHPGPEGVAGARLLLVDAGAAELLVVDLDTPDAYASFPLPAAEEPEWTLLSGREAALLVLAGPPVRAWRVDPAVGVSTEVDLQLDLPDDAIPEIGWLEGETLYAQYRDGDGALRFRIVDLAAGAATDVDLDHSVSEIWPADGGLFLFDAGDPLVGRLPSFARWAPPDGALARTELPWDAMHSACPSPDGRVLVQFHDPREGLGMLDPAEDRWEITEPPCEIGGSFYPRLLLAGETPLSFFHVPSGEGLGQPVVTLVTWTSP